MSQSKPRIVIVGGGFAGALAGRELRRVGAYEVAIDLIDPKNHFVFQPLLPEVAGGAVNSLDTVTPLRLLIPGGHVRIGLARRVDLDARRVEVVQGSGGAVSTMPYDYLVVAPGMTVDLSRYPGLTEHAWTIKSALDAHALRNHVISCMEEAARTTDPAERRRLLTFVTIGGGLSGVEILGEVQQLVRDSLRLYDELLAGDVRLELIEYGDRILPELGPELAQRATDLLRARGIAVRTRTPVREASVRCVTVGDGLVIPAATVIAALGNAPTEFAKSLPLPKEKGRIVVDPDLRVPGYPGVWAIGDAARVPTTDGGVAPMTAQAAVRQARLLARNILAVTDGKATKPFAYSSRGTLASLGGRRGVADLWGGRVRLDGRLAWWLWRLVHLAMLPQAGTRWRVGLDQVLDLFLPRRSVLTGEPPRPATAFVRHRAGDLAFCGSWLREGAFVVVEGSYVEERPDAPARHLRPGDHFGALQVLEGKPEVVSVRAMETSRCLQLAPDDLRRLMAALEAVDGRTPLQDIAEEERTARAASQ